MEKENEFDYYLEWKLSGFLIAISEHIQVMIPTWKKPCYLLVEFLFRFRISRWPILFAKGEPFGIVSFKNWLYLAKKFDLCIAASVLSAYSSHGNTWCEDALCRNSWRWFVVKTKLFFLNVTKFIALELNLSRQISKHIYFLRSIVKQVLQFHKKYTSIQIFMRKTRELKTRDVAKVRNHTLI